jgi:O-methyltransferase
LKKYIREKLGNWNHIKQRKQMKQFIKRFFADDQWRFLTAKKAEVLLFFQTVFRFFGKPVGIDSFIRKPAYHYVPDYYGRGAHKQNDIRVIPVFGELAAEVINSGRTSLYYDRLFTIYQALVDLKSRIKPGQIINTAEVGAYKGGTSFFIASIADRLRMNVTHHCFDTFEGHASQDINAAIDTAHQPAFFSDTSYEDVKKYLSPYGNVLIYKGRFQDTCQNIDAKEMHFAHLDMDIYEPTLFALKYFNRTLVSGGVILVDDYGFVTCPGIVKAVEEFMAVQRNYFGIPLLTGQYFLVKLRDQEQV